MNTLNIILVVMGLSIVGLVVVLVMAQQKLSKCNKNLQQIANNNITLQNDALALYKLSGRPITTAQVDCINKDTSLNQFAWFAMTTDSCNKANVVADPNGSLLCKKYDVSNTATKCGI